MHCSFIDQVEHGAHALEHSSPWHFSLLVAKASGFSHEQAEGSSRAACPEGMVVGQRPKGVRAATRALALVKVENEQYLDSPIISLYVSNKR
jgi:hypothetical protein